MTEKPLSVLRREDRDIMARRVEAIVAATGALCVRRQDHAGKPRCTSVEIAAPGGLTVDLILDGDAGGLHELHFLQWKMKSDSRNKLAPVFGGVNASQFCKATQVAYSFEALCEQLELCLRLAATGEAYQPVRKATPPLAQADHGPERNEQQVRARIAG
jgi:hypothetical protein